MSNELPERNGTLRVLAVGVVVAAILIGIFVLTRDNEADDGADGADSSAPATVDPSELVPATDASLVAVTLEHVDVDPRYFKALYRENGDYTKGTVGGEIWFGGTSDDDADLIRLTAAPFGSGSDSCEYYECSDVQTDAGEATLFWQEAVPGREEGIVGVELARNGMLLRVHANSRDVESTDPRGQELPVSVDDMVEILTDPRFGIETTPDMIEAGEDLDLREG